MQSPNQRLKLEYLKYLKEVIPVGDEQPQSEQPKKLDAIDYTLIAAFMIALVTVCIMMIQIHDVPVLMQNIFWALGMALGMKRVPTT